MCLDNSDEYTGALARSRLASIDYRRAVQDYRARRITDSEFLRARRAHDLVMAEFERAWQAEREAGEVVT